LLNDTAFLHEHQVVKVNGKTAWFSHLSNHSVLWL